MVSYCPKKSGHGIDGCDECPRYLDDCDGDKSGDDEPIIAELESVHDRFSDILRLVHESHPNWKDEYDDGKSILNRLDKCITRLKVKNGTCE